MIVKWKLPQYSEKFSKVILIANNDNINIKLNFLNITCLKMQHKQFVQFFLKGFKFFIKYKFVVIFCKIMIGRCLPFLSFHCYFTLYFNIIKYLTFINKLFGWKLSRLIKILHVKRLICFPKAIYFLLSYYSKLLSISIANIFHTE